MNSVLFMQQMMRKAGYVVRMGMKRERLVRQADRKEGCDL